MCRDPLTIPRSPWAEKMKYILGQVVRLRIRRILRQDIFVIQSNTGDYQINFDEHGDGRPGIYISSMDQCHDPVTVQVTS